MGSMLRIAIVSANILLALFIFQNGFLLKRQEISATSSCSDAHAQPGETCWMSQQYNRTILILVDALRYDFLIPLDKPKSSESPEWFYQGQMKEVGKLIKSGKASIGTLLADPPTTTLQRLKALTTGTLPTFIDAGDNFSPDAAVNEDSFIYQAAQLGKNVTLFGDDTWLSLFPNKFSKSAAYDSFDINDLNSVDDKIAPKLEEEVKYSESSSIIIAHFLGVDHCGHKFGPSHPVMADTLRKMDRIISKTVESMKPTDLLIVIGDHGMTSTGDHGGESDNEIRAGILVHSKKHEIQLPKTSIHQIDIYPNSKMELGGPLKGKSLGRYRFDEWKFWVAEFSVFWSEPESLLEFHCLILHHDLRFAETYASQKNFGELHSHTARDSNTMEEQIKTMSRIQTLLRVAWTQFDDAYINVGLFSLIEAVFFLITNEEMSAGWIIYRTGCALLQAALLTDKTDSDGSARTMILMALAVSCLSSTISLAHRALRISLNSIVSARVIGKKKE
ncbi:Protein CBG20246 [Caenorhabditis briggsae]|uniref:Protein CBG20246 n=1 Tax=Caenorhabditis briggsae TaxID=6238 RepID=A8XXE8_CAEBR|nr:Protein CBG20246 [Caenorhabditis briggsae]CAP37337.2 Protein CBG20246 [Caenorhabditis briggsae]